MGASLSGHVHTWRVHALILDPPGSYRVFPGRTYSRYREVKRCDAGGCSEEVVTRLECVPQDEEYLTGKVHRAEPCQCPVCTWMRSGGNITWP